MERTIQPTAKQAERHALGKHALTATLSDPAQLDAYVAGIKNIDDAREVIAFLARAVVHLLEK